jgi:hypothetical protein
MRGNVTSGALVERSSYSTDVTADSPDVHISGGRWRHNTATMAIDPGPTGWDADLVRDVRPIRFELDGVDVGGAAENRFHRRVPGCRSPLPLGVVSWVWDDRTREYCTPP